MRPAGVQSAAPPTDSQIAGRGTTPVEEMAEAVITIHARCIALPARTVERRRRCLFNQAGTGLCTVAPVIRRSVIAVTTVDHAGNVYD